MKQFNNMPDRHGNVCQYYLKCGTKIHDLEITDSVKELPYIRRENGSIKKRLSWKSSAEG